jgi:rRNA maturation endonuclease Nob1
MFAFVLPVGQSALKRGDAVTLLEALKGLPAQREMRKLRGALKELTECMAQCLDALDRWMKQPSTVERGRAIAAISNALEMANDGARYFGLGVDYRKDKKVEFRTVCCGSTATGHMSVEENLVCDNCGKPTTLERRAVPVRKKLMCIDHVHECRPGQPGIDCTGCGG